SEEPNRRLFLKLARRIKTAAVIKQHCEPNIGFRARDIADRPQLTINPKLKIIKIQIHNSSAALIDNGSRNRDEIRADLHDVVFIDFISRSRGTVWRR